MELPALTGTEKQVAWAITIRARAVADFAATRDRIAHASDRAVAAGQISRDDADAAITVEVDAPIANALAHTAAGWWIERNGSAGVRILRECATS